jgi:site-specific DNA-methyltransferase (adenine-specific)
LKDSGTLYIYGFPEILYQIAAYIEPMEQKWLCWHYTNKAVPSLKFWQRSYETIICCWKTNQRIFNLDDVREPYTDVFLKNAAGKKRKGTKGRFSHEGVETTYTAHEQGALPRDVIKVPALAGGAGKSERWFLCKTCNDVFQKEEGHEGHKIVEHPTQKPYELTKKLLLAAKPKENGRVLIPFVGTGSECAVAEDLGMSYIGFEINPDYVDLAQKFLNKRKGNDPDVPF